MSNGRGPVPLPLLIVAAMSEIDITVRGTHTFFAPPERATVTLVVAIDGADAGAVHRDVATTADAVRRSVEPLHDPELGPITWWSNEQIHTWATRPWNQDGKVLPLVHHARVTFSVKFADFEQLSTWLASTAELPGASVGGIEWALTAAHREQAITRVRQAAVRDAIDKARTYADAVDADTVRVLAIADAGMLGDGLHPTQGTTPKFARMAASADAASPIELAPEDVAISVEVDVRCVAGTNTA